MKRLFRISLNIFMNSIIPIITWLMLGFLIDQNLVNLFTIMYPFQFIQMILFELFGVGANIYAKKENQKDATSTGMIQGIIVGFFLCLIGIFFLKDYLSFMNVDVNTYYIFGIYNIVQLYLQMIVSIVVQKLYYEEQLKKANLYTFLFNGLNLFTLIISVLLFKNSWTIILSTIFILTIYVIILLLKNLQAFHFTSSILNYFRYNSSEIISNLFFFFIFFFGFSNVFEFLRRNHVNYDLCNFSNGY